MNVALSISTFRSYAYALAFSISGSCTVVLIQLQYCIKIRTDALHRWHARSLELGSGFWSPPELLRLAPTSIACPPSSEPPHPLPTPPVPLRDDCWLGQQLAPPSTTFPRYLPGRRLICSRNWSRLFPKTSFVHFNVIRLHTAIIWALSSHTARASYRQKLHNNII